MNNSAINATFTVTFIDGHAMPVVEVKAIRASIIDLVRNEFVRTIPEISKVGTKAFRKHLIDYVVLCGGAKNSGPTEYNTVMQEAIAAGLIRKEKRGVLVATDALQVNRELRLPLAQMGRPKKSISTSVMAM
jgi:hypothetical protein